MFPRPTHLCPLWRGAPFPTAFLPCPGPSHPSPANAPKKLKPRPPLPRGQPRPRPIRRRVPLGTTPPPPPSSLEIVTKCAQPPGRGISLAGRPAHMGRGLSPPEPELVAWYGPFANAPHTLCRSQEQLRPPRGTDEKLRPGVDKFCRNRRTFPAPPETVHRCIDAGASA